MRRCWHMLLAAAGPIIIGSVGALAAFSDHGKAIGADSDHFLCWHWSEVMQLWGEAMEKIAEPFSRHVFEIIFDPWECFWYDDELFSNHAIEIAWDKTKNFPRSWPWACFWKHEACLSNTFFDNASDKTKNLSAVMSVRLLLLQRRISQLSCLRTCFCVRHLAPTRS